MKRFLMMTMLLLACAFNTQAADNIPVDAPVYGTWQFPAAQNGALTIIYQYLLSPGKIAVHVNRKQIMIGYWFVMGAKFEGHWAPLSR